MDPLIKSTIASSFDITALYQWLFVLFCGAIMLAFGIAVENLRRSCSNATERGINVLRVLQYLCLAPEMKVAQRAIQGWRTRVVEGMHHCDNDQHEHGAFEPLTKATALPSVTPGRVLLYWTFHLPLLILASAPAFGFVLSQNVPAGGGWYWTILSNSIFIAGLKLGIQTKSEQPLYCAVQVLVRYLFQLPHCAWQCSDMQSQKTTSSGPILR